MRCFNNFGVGHISLHFSQSRLLLQRHVYLWPFVRLPFSCISQSLLILCWRFSKGGHDSSLMFFHSTIISCCIKVGSIWSIFETFISAYKILVYQWKDMFFGTQPLCIVKMFILKRCDFTKTFYIVAFLFSHYKSGDTMCSVCMLDWQSIW